MDIEAMADDAVHLYNILYPFVKQYGIPAFDLLKTMIDSDIHPETITNQVLKQQAQAVLQANAELQKA